MILDAIVAEKRRALAARDRAADHAARDRLSGAPPRRPFTEALRRSPAPQVVAEFKRRSPSAGAIRPGADARTIAADYARAGAAALSILTDEKFFDGRLDDLAAARAGSLLPSLRKDFALDAVDLVEARLAGADAALLIVRLLDDAALRSLLAEAAALDLEALVEVHSAEECRRAVAAGARLVGVNHRDLDTLAIDLALSERLAPLLPDGVVRVAESGLRTAADLRAMAERGYHAVLVGEALLRAPSPGAALEALRRG